MIKLFKFITLVCLVNALYINPVVAFNFQSDTTDNTASKQQYLCYKYGSGYYSVFLQEKDTIQTPTDTISNSGIIVDDEWTYYPSVKPPEWPARVRKILNDSCDKNRMVGILMRHVDTSAASQITSIDIDYSVKLNGELISLGMVPHFNGMPSQFYDYATLVKILNEFNEYKIFKPWDNLVDENVRKVGGAIRNINCLVYNAKLADNTCRLEDAHLLDTTSTYMTGISHVYRYIVRDIAYSDSLRKISYIPDTNVPYFPISIDGDINSRNSKRNTDSLDRCAAAITRKTFDKTQFVDIVLKNIKPEIIQNLESVNALMTIRNDGHIVKMELKPSYLHKYLKYSDVYAEKPDRKFDSLDCYPQSASLRNIIETLNRIPMFTKWSNDAGLPEYVLVSTFFYINKDISRTILGILTFTDD